MATNDAESNIREQKFVTGRWRIVSVKYGGMGKEAIEKFTLIQRQGKAMIFLAISVP
jgi:hypothetical protein